MAKDPPNTQDPKRKGASSAFQKFEELARRIVRTPKNNTDPHPRKRPPR